MLDEMMRLTTSLLASVRQVSLSLDDVMAIVTNLTTESMAYFYDPDIDRHFVAIGETAAMVAVDATRFDMAKCFVRNLRDALVHGHPEQLRVFGGFAFSDQAAVEPTTWSTWPKGKLFLPTVLFEIDESLQQTTVTICVPMGIPDFDPPLVPTNLSAWNEWVLHLCDQTDWPQKTIASNPTPASGTNPPSLTADTGVQDHYDKWIQLVQKGTDAVRTGQLKKVVLARQMVEPTQKSSLQVVRALGKRYSNNFIFAFWHQGACFLGSSPERIVSFAAGMVLSLIHI